MLELLILIEDKRFPRHRGIDALGILRAAKHNLAGRPPRQGASTIPQQLYSVRLNRLNGKKYSRTIGGKLVQIGFGLWISRRFSKIEVVSEYLANVYWGASRYGIAEAARSYFDKECRDLTIEESFYLVERLASPNRRTTRRVQVITSRAVVVDLLERHGSSVRRLMDFYDEISPKSSYHLEPENLRS